MINAAESGATYWQRTPNLNRGLHCGWLWPMYGPTVYPAAYHCDWGQAKQSQLVLSKGERAVSVWPTWVLLLVESRQDSLIILTDEGAFQSKRVNKWIEGVHSVLSTVPLCRHAFADIRHAYPPPRLTGAFDKGLIIVAVDFNEDTFWK